MQKFLTTLFLFTIILCILGEIIIRIFHVVPDIPERYIDKYGIQRYKPEQTGYYSRSKSKWEVNSYGWLGVADINKDTIVSIIGDSYIENIINPIECNQGSLLNSINPNYAFFEAGRSGVTFIEALQISKILDFEVGPTYHLIYLNENDFYESISELVRYNDRIQVSVDKQEILPCQLKNPGLKKILYNFKLIYYLYLKYPIIVDQQNKNALNPDIAHKETFDYEKLSKLFEFCSNNYNLSKFVFVFHPNTDDRIISMTKRYGIKTIILNSHGDKSWGLGMHDGHWSCYGHLQVSKQVNEYLKKL